MMLTDTYASGARVWTKHYSHFKQLGMVAIYNKCVVYGYYFCLPFYSQLQRLLLNEKRIVASFLQQHLKRSSKRKISKQKLCNQEWKKRIKQTKLLECSGEFGSASDQAFLAVESEQDVCFENRLKAGCRIAAENYFILLIQIKLLNFKNQDTRKDQE